MTVGRRHTLLAVPSFDVLEPLAPNACRSDPSAPCFYWHTKVEALNGGRDKLSERERAFIGVEVWPIKHAGLGFADGAVPGRSPRGLRASAEDSAALHAIMSLGSQERLEFLG
jgi:hypothetical protein